MGQGAQKNDHQVLFGEGENGLRGTEKLEQGDSEQKPESYNFV